MKNHSFPHNTTAKFPYDIWQRKFNWGFFSPYFTKGTTISTDEIAQVLEELEEIQKPHTKRAFILVLYYALSLIAMATGFLVFEMFFVDKNKPLQFVGFINFLMTFFFIVLAMIYQGKKHNEKVKADCETIIEKYNLIFVKKGFKWHIPCYFPRSIELIKISQAQNLNSSLSDALHQGNQLYTPPTLF